MTNDDPNTLSIQTRIGAVRLRKRGGLWYARKQQKGDRIELALGTENLNIAIERAQEIMPAAINGSKVFDSDGRKIVGHEDFLRIVEAARGRAKRRGIEFTLTAEDVEALIIETQGCCKLTGVPFSMARMDGAYRAPFAPSLDRITSIKGYTKDNCRFICVAVNWALSDWGVDIFETIAVGYATTILREWHYKKTGQ